MLTNTTGTANRDENNQSVNNPISPPTISLPKGGGAIRGIGEKFAANPVTGTGSMTVPICTSPGRSGFGPQFSLSYDSGTGNGPFGFGWSLALPSLTRKTDKGLPQYADAEESDTFILSGAEDLVPLLVENNSQWARDVSSRTVYGKQYSIQRYRPRVEGLFARIERWVNLSDPQDTFWRSISRDNITTWYGKTAESRLADPSDGSRVFTWLICESYDDKGNVIVYQYKLENSDGLDLSQAHERNRSEESRSANRYLKHVFYGNRTPYFPDLTAGTPVPLPSDWYFELVFDYGEHDDQAPVPQETGKSWDCRSDPFSSYRATFEIRTYRLCRRALMFHHFTSEPDVGLNCLVRSTDFTHAQATQTPADPGRPFYSFLLSVTQTGYRRNVDGSYLSKTLPPLEFAYTEAVIDETVWEIDAESLENLPYGLDGTHYQWVDLDGEGVSGILAEQAGSWFYKPNLSPANLHTENGMGPSAHAQFAPVQLVARQPSLASLQSGRQHLMDLAGDGHLALAQFDGPAPGFFKRTEEEGWEPFTPFMSLPVLDWRNPNLKFIDLTGDGYTDLLISEDDAFWWHTSLAAAGFGPAQRVPQALDEEQGPKLVFTDGTESIFLADISGDGLTDLVRIRNGEVCYWPNLGYGRFGARVAMDQAPWFERPDLFDGRRIRLADIDGSGTADIIYFASGGVHLYFNQSGNAWGERRVLSQFPPVESVSSATVLDLLGNGTACLVWSSPLPGNARQPMRYLDLMGGQKPHLLVQMTNNLGAETRIQYAPSTRFYVADKLAGTPWLTRIPFPIYVVERVEVYDYVSRNRFVTRYAYHHGFYDGVEREFHGFGRVDQWDTEEFATLTNSGAFPQAINLDAAYQVPPVWTRTWFHTGAYFGEARISKHLEQEYYRAGDAITGPDDTILPTTIRLSDEASLPAVLSADEAREACRALKGALLRQEIYALDGMEAEGRPYSVSEHNYTIEWLQPHGINRYAVFFTHARESLDFHSERTLYDVNGQKLADPRITHTMTLAVDAFGNVLQTVAVAYGRRYTDPDPRLSADDQRIQQRILLTATENQYTHPIQQDDLYRLPLPAEARSYELIHVTPDANLFSFDELAGKVQAASDGQHDLPYEDIAATGATVSAPYRRLLNWTRRLYRRDDLSGPLPLGQLEPLALPFESYTLSLTPGLLASIYQPQSGQATEMQLLDPTKVLGTEGGYVRSNDLKADGRFTASDPDDHWWAPSGQAFYSPTIGESAAQELGYARQHFFLARRIRSPFGNTTILTYDGYDLLPQETLDALGNRVTAGTRDSNDHLTSTGNNYRVLQPQLMMDANRNRSAIAFDALGMVVGTAAMGKPEENLGDTLTDFSPDLTDTVIAAHLQDPLAHPQDVLQQASTRLIYDLFAYQRTRHDPQPQPPVVYTLARETHAADLAQGQQTKVQHRFSYSDGFGREIQQKRQAEPGPLVEGGPESNPRWVGSGWIILNNKGKPVRQYEPFFGATHQFEFAMQVGVSPVLFYDPVGRVVATLHPNHTYEKAVFDPWKQITWDVNDTVLLAPKTDPDVAGFFQRLPDADCLPTWYEQRQGGALGAQEQTAAQQAAVHANTPGIACFDTLGRIFLTVAHNRFIGNNAPIDEYYASRSILDILGKLRAASDARNRVAVRSDYEMLGGHIHQASQEAGERWVLNDVSGKVIHAWDSRGHWLHTSYDTLRRPLELHLHTSDGAELLIEQTLYGETQSNPEAGNLRGKVYQVFDQAGKVTSGAYDFKGNLLQGSRQLATSYTQSLDWATTVALDASIYTSSTTYDALNRPVAMTTPDTSVIHHIYNEANLLEQIVANMGNAATATSFVTNIDYNAKGQRTQIEYGNGVSTQYVYDPQTFRLTHLFTTRGAAFLSDGTDPANPPAGVQNLRYTYDPVGNITHIQDDAQQTIYFRNRRVEPSADYTYDAVYRLIEASGREHLAQAGGGGSSLAPIALTYDDGLRMGSLQPGDGTAMGRYSQQYIYDEVGNILQILHHGTDLINPGWTRTYTYNEPSLLEASKMSNRLTGTQLGSDPTEQYTYDQHGNMISMSHLPLIQWDYKDQLQATTQQVVSTGGMPETTYYVYNCTGQRVRKVTERQTAQGQTPTRMKERIYIGGFEIYREYGGDGSTIALERETLQVMDDKQRIVLVETRTQGSDRSPRQLTRYQLSNHLDSASLELDDQAHILSHEEYYPFGGTSYQAMDSQTETPKRYRYTGKERDEENGLYYHGARYYAPWLGRWTSCDPVTDFKQTSLYTYAANNPPGFKDPDGRDPQPAPASAYALPPPPAPPGVSEEQYNESKRRDEALHAKWRAAAREGQLAGADVGETLAYAREALSKDGFFHYEDLKKRGPKGAEAAQKLLESVQDDITRSLAKFPHFEDAYEQESAVAAFQVAIGQSFEQTRLELGTRKIALDILMYAGTAAVDKALDEASLLLIRATARQLVGPMLRPAIVEAAESAIATGRDVGPVVAGVVDLRTGQSFFALNAEGLPENLHPILKARIDALADAPQHFSMPGTHAEIFALNDALWARTNAGMKVTERSLRELVLDTAWLRGSGRGRMVPLQPAPRCGNCSAITDGVINMAGDAPPKPPAAKP